MRILLTGANGQLGRCLQDRIPADWTLLPLASADLDITHSESVAVAVAEFKPDVIINAAAYTAVDKAENEVELARQVNRQGPANLAQAAKDNNARFIHVSTDYVFDGTSEKPYLETDTTNPLGVYGQTKLDGEKAVAEIFPDSIIVRTAWVFSEYGNNFLKTMLRVGEQRDVLSVVADQYGCPTYAGDIANTIISLIKLDAEGGIYHFSGDQETSWHGFAKKIFDLALENSKIRHAPVVEAITTDQYPTLAVRPTYSILSNRKIEVLGIKASRWEEAIKDVLIKLKY
ncbi:dTDP-4-dehydrorhamnose reductase [Erwinia sp. Leaf53]|uniref:dTDP-4-dehydrorhamnose reductase n=1 Tax=Erwinia sp. Leaf53 TaxID=1736225 RepID=UPI000701E2C4|nr:dTDP-4-dehydrorhamnose reductase [Erwinia sp. Leaf53]KQN63722.1 NAD(P)-dependent oxidoreductase [Erwinia sp. Leaf53]